MAIKIIGNLKQELRNLAKEEFQKLAKISNQIYNQAIENVEAVDTGALKNSSYVTVEFPFIRFWTAIPYAVFVIYGLGTNRKYGPRNYPVFSAKALKSQVENGSYSLPKMKGAKK